MTENFIKNYQRTPEPIQAAIVTDSTAERIANWCGGSWGHEREVETYLEVVVPNIAGNLKARENQFVIRTANGRFYVMTQEEFVKAGYVEYEYEIDVEARLKDVVGDDFTIAKSFTPHYVPRGKHPFAG